MGFSVVVLEIVGYLLKPLSLPSTSKHWSIPYLMKLTGAHRSNFVLGDIRKAPHAIYQQVTDEAPQRLMKWYQMAACEEL